MKPEKYVTIVTEGVLNAPQLCYVTRDVGRIKRWRNRIQRRQLQVLRLRGENWGLVVVEVTVDHSGPYARLTLQLMP